MTRIAGGLLGILMTTASYAASLRIVDAWIEESPPGVPVLAGYVVLENHGPNAVRVTKVRSPKAERVEIHRSEVTDTTATMRRLTELTIPPGGRLAFSPGDYHLMIFGVEPTPQSGSKLPLEVELDSGEKITVQATVRRSAPPTGGEHDHHEHE